MNEVLSQIDQSSQASVKEKFSLEKFVNGKTHKKKSPTKKIDINEGVDEKSDKESLNVIFTR